jgi:hypothetical protein
MAYDEEAERTRRIWGHCTHLMTDFERRSGRAATTREKAAASENETMARMLSQRWGLSGDPDVELALSGGSGGIPTVGLPSDPLRAGRRDHQPMPAMRPDRPHPRGAAMLLVRSRPAWDRGVTPPDG